MSKSILLAAAASISLSAGAADALPLSLPLLGGIVPAPHASSPGTSSAVANTAGIVQAVIDPFPSLAGGILSPLVSLNESDAAHAFAELSGPADPHSLAIDPALLVDTDILSMTGIAGTLLSPGGGSDALLRLTNLTMLSATLGLSGLGPVPGIKVGIDPLELCLSLALGGNAAACPASIGAGPSAVPEPASLALLGAGIASLALFGVRRRNRMPA